MRLTIGTGTKQERHLDKVAPLIKLGRIIRKHVAIGTRSPVECGRVSSVCERTLSVELLQILRALASQAGHPVLGVEAVNFGEDVFVLVLQVIRRGLARHKGGLGDDAGKEAFVFSAVGDELKSDGSCSGGLTVDHNMVGITSKLFKWLACYPSYDPDESV